MKRIVSIQDLSCIGKCSLGVALPVLSAMGLECAALPTALLSAHTAFDGFVCRDMQEFFRPVAAHWRALGVRFDAVSTGYLGDPALVAHLDPELVKKAAACMTQMVEDCVDRMKTTAGDIEVILVGGGSILVPDTLKGVSQVFKPANFGVANAIGSAISQVSGQIEKVYSLEKIGGRAAALADAKALATEEAIKAGADPDTIEIIDVEDVPLAYLPGNATRVRVKAVGDLKI